MKKTTIKMLFSLLIMLSITLVSAQTTRDAFVPNKVGNVLEKIQSVGNSVLKIPNDLLSIEEQQKLQNYYNSQETPNSAFRAFGDVYVLDLFPGTDGYGSMPLTGPFTITNIATVTGDIFASDMSPGGDIYAIDQATAGLFTIAKDTGVTTPVATLTGAPAGVTFTGISWNPVDSTFYVLATDGTTTTFFSLDSGTGALTTIGVTGNALGIWIAIDNAGIIYMADVGDDSLYTIDATTGVGTIVGALGVDINFAQEADIDPTTNTLYMASYTAAGASEILSVDVTTGTATSLGAVTNAPELGVFAIDGGIDNNFICDDAIAIGLGVIPSNGPSNTAGGASNVCETGATNAEWYSYTAANSGDLTISSDLVTNVGIDTRVSVYNDDCTALVCIDSDDNSGADNTSTIVIPVVSGTTYYIEWDDANNADPFDFELSLVIGCTDPTNFSNDAVTDTSADFSWDMVVGATNGYVLNVFNAGDDPDVDTPVYTENIPSGTLTATATPLSSDATYDAYLNADCDTDGTSNAVLVTFITEIAPPVCGGVYLDSGGVAGDYSNDEIITTTATPDVPGDVVTVTFTYVDIEATAVGVGSQDGCWDFLTVYNGPDNTFPVLAATLCGEESGDGDVPSDPDSLLSVGMSFTSTDASGALTFVFTSDNVVVETGWSADVTCGPPPACVTPGAFTNTLTTDTEATYTWSEIANASNGYVFSVFNAGDDPTTDTPVYTENVPFGTNTATASGLTSETPYDAYIAADCDADGISTDDSDTFTTGITPPACDGIYVDSGGAGGNYSDNENITTTITPDVSGEVVTVTFTYVDIETATGVGTQDGCWDFLTIYNGPDIASPVLAQTLCGEESGDGGVPSVPESLLSIGMSFTSTDASGALTFVFTSDGSVTPTGWVADVTCGPPPSCETPGSFTNTLTTDTEATYTWDEVANAANGYVFSVFNAGDDPTTDTPVYSENVAFGTNTATATGLSQATLYDAYISADCDTNGISSDDSDSFITEAGAEVCDGNYVDSGGVTGDYANDENITTTITPAVAGEAVTVTFTYVDIETATGVGAQDGCWDFLTIYNGPDTASPVLAQTLCGEESGDGGVPSVPESLLSVGMSFTSTDAASGALTFVFTSDTSVPLTGWLANITCATLSVDEFALAQFNYYPNPTTGLLNINAKQNIDTIKVFNTLGQVVMDLSPNAMDTTLDFTNLSQGTYFLRSSINGNIATHKIIKK